MRETLSKIEGMCGVDITLPHITLNLYQQELSEPSRVGNLYCSFVVLQIVGSTLSSSGWGRRSNKWQHTSSENEILEVWHSLPNDFKSMKAFGIAFLTLFGLSYACEQLWIISYLTLKQTMTWVLHVFLSNLQNSAWVKVTLIVSKNHINSSKACQMETLTFQ